MLLEFYLKSRYTLDVIWSILIQPMYYSGNHGVSSEYLSFFFRQAIILYIQFEFMILFLQLKDIPVAVL